MYNAASMNISIENASPNAQGNHLRGYGLGEGGIRTLLWHCESHVLFSVT